MGALDGKIAIVTGTSRGVGVGIAHELLRAGATVIGCSRSQLDALPGTEADPDWARPIRANGLRPRRLPRHRRLGIGGGRDLRPHRHPRQQRRRHGAHPERRGRARARPEDPGRTAQRRRLRAHGAVSLVRDPDEPDQPAVVRHSGVSADARPGRHRVDHQHLQRHRPPRRFPDAGVLRRRQGRSEPHDPVAGRGMGARVRSTAWPSARP